jgi:putative ABC transport system ATP-binding protein
MRVLEIENVVRSFVTPAGNRSPIVDVPRFSLDAGQQVALAGASGSGKTTFLNLIAGILQPDSGRIVVCGRVLSAAGESLRDAVRAAHIGYIFQTFNLLQGYTALENVELGMMFGRGRDTTYARHLLERVGLKDRMAYRPRQLSAGQQQRVAVARALANHPELVLADEPTGNLDQRHAHAALDLIREVCRESGAALLLVSHDRDVLATFEDVRQLSEINRATAEVALTPVATTGGASR